MSRAKPKPASFAWRLLNTLAIAAALLGVDAALTRHALQGQWQMEMTADVETHLATLLAAQHEAPAGGLGGVLRQSIQQGLSRAGGAVLRGAASQVRVEVVGSTFRVTQGSGEMVAAALISLASEEQPESTECSRGRIVAIFPIMVATCVSPGEDPIKWLLMRGWPGETLRLLPLALTERQLGDLTAQLKASSKGEVASRPTPEVRAAVEEIFTLRFKKLPEKL